MARAARVTGFLHTVGLPVALLGLLFHGAGADKAAEWSYDDPSAWGRSYPDANGKAQSPIDISTLSMIEGQEQVGDLLKYHPMQSRTIANNGKNEQVNGNFGTFELPDGLYDAVQFHFHFPSEHTINGKRASGEMHIVHQQRGGSSIAVVALLLEEGDNASQVPSQVAFFSGLGFGEKLPKKASSETVDGEVDLSAFADIFRGNYYHYVGSLTTPPCTEGVHWYVFDQRASVSPQQVDSFKKIFPNPENFRPVQPLNERKVVMTRLSVGDEFKGSKSKKDSGESGSDDSMLWLLGLVGLVLGAYFFGQTLRGSPDDGSTNYKLVTNEA